jgi:flagellar assembly protein FliH
MIAKAIIDRDDPENVAVTFMPKKFPMRVTQNAVSFHKIQSGENRTDFRMDHIVSENTGVSELERMSIEEKVEMLALSKVKEIQEEAYAAGYQLGLEEGNKRGFEDYKAELMTRLEDFDGLLLKIENLKSELINHNETFLIQLMYQMATKIAMDEIQARPDIILPIMRQAVEAAQSDQKITVKLSTVDLKFILGVREQLSKDFDFVKNLKLEESSEITSGGCKIETNYGMINASVEQRVKKLWESIVHKTPRTKDSVGDGA